MTDHRFPPPPKAKLEDLVNRMGIGPCKAYSAEIRRRSSSYLEARRLDPESLLILNLTIREGTVAAGYEVSNWLFVGEDGLGNYFFVDAVNGPTVVKLLSHDPPGIEDPGISLRDFISAAQIHVPSRDYQSSEWVICRADDPRRAILNPIELGEWKAVAAMHSCIELLGYRRGTNPFTGEVIQFPVKGGAYVEWQGKSTFACLFAGGVYFDGPPENFMPFARTLALQLEANLFPGRDASRHD